LVQPQERNSLAIGSHYIQDDSWDDSDYNPFHGTEEKITSDLRTVLARSAQSPVTIPPTAISVTHIRHRGTAHSILKRHEGNSGVLIKGSNIPYCIDKILQFPQTKDQCMLQGTWVVLRPHSPAYVTSDPYMQYPHLRMRLWGQELASTSKAVPISTIDTHFAKRNITWKGKQVAVVASLSRVRLTLSYESKPTLNNVP
jgi:hypothetical protein